MLSLRSLELHLAALSDIDDYDVAVDETDIHELFTQTVTKTLSLARLHHLSYCGFNTAGFFPKLLRTAKPSLKTLRLWDLTMENMEELGDAQRILAGTSPQSLELRLLHIQHKRFKEQKKCEEYVTRWCFQWSLHDDDPDFEADIRTSIAQTRQVYMGHFE
jgi:hypothetical protein